MTKSKCQSPHSISNEQHSVGLPDVKFLDESVSPYILSCDIGTTKLRCMVYNDQAEILGCAEEKIQLYCPLPGYAELNPSTVWEKFISTIKNAISDSGLHVSQITCIGLSTQRATFVLWDKVTGETLHNLVTWKDLRADVLVEAWNRSFTMKLIRTCSGILYNIVKKKRFFAASVIKFQNVQVNMRLKWVLENNPSVKEALAKGNVLFGTLDTWLVYKLTGGKVHATEHSNASGTAIYDPYLLKWNHFLTRLINLPKSIFPEVRDSIGHWGDTLPELFGVSLPITCVISDQGGAMFGGCGFNQGDVKITLGTGAFFDVNTGTKPHMSIKGIYPVVGWKTKDGIVYMAEGSSHDNGSIIEWGKSIGLYKTYAESGIMAASVENSNNVFFIPGFQGLQAPINDAKATGGFLGITCDTKVEHLVRAMLESLAFRVYQIYLAMKQEANYDSKHVRSSLPIRVDGGVAQNDFLMQLISTLLDKSLERPKNIETSSLGCCFLAGMGAGIWENSSQVEPLKAVEKIFYPEKDKRAALLISMAQWEKALVRFTKWYSDEGHTGKKSI